MLRDRLRTDHREHFRRTGGFHRRRGRRGSHFREWRIAGAIIVYGFMASVLPVWLLLAPREYLSTFVKLGVVLLLALGVSGGPSEFAIAAPDAIRRRQRPHFAGKIFPFCFITIACGAISGFHALISSGTTPKLLAKETKRGPSDMDRCCSKVSSRMMALIAAAPCSREFISRSTRLPGSSARRPAAASAMITGWGFPVTPADMQQLATDVGEKTLFYRTGGAPSLALGMAHIFTFVRRKPARCWRSGITSRSCSRRCSS